jgi:DNA-binding CsgD family transcriptional regulator
MKHEQGNRTESLLALLLLQGMKGATQAEKAVQLSLAGFTSIEIANLLQTTTAVVHQHLYSMRKKKKK